MRSTFVFCSLVFEVERLVSMRYSKLIKDIRLGLSEAVIADKEKAYTRAWAILLHVRSLIDRKIVKEKKNGKAR